MDKAEGSKLKGIVYLRTVGEADDLVREIEVTFLRLHYMLHRPSILLRLENCYDWGSLC